MVVVAAAAGVPAGVGEVPGDGVTLRHASPNSGESTHERRTA
jgi:hypothetical protein